LRTNKQTNERKGGGGGRMESLEAVVANTLALSSTFDDLSHLSSLLKQSEDLLVRNLDKLGDVLGALDAGRHSLACLHILDVLSSRVPVGSPDSGEVICRISSFINDCSADQIRLAPELFASVCHKLKDFVMTAGNLPIKAILPLQTAIRKIQPTPEHFTPQHADFTLVCLLSKCYNAALPILDTDIFEVDPKKTALTPRDFLLYCYYGGTVYIGLKRFNKALQLFHHAITAPSTVLNAITIAAYKKFVLVSLIVNGQLAQFPKYTPSIVQRSLKTQSQAYVNMGNAYATRNVEEVQRCITSHHEGFNNDRNLGLAKQVVASLYKRNIQRLTQTYLTLSLQDIADTVKLEGPRDAEMHVLRMIEDGEIFATINQKDGMVRFHEDSEQYNTMEMAERLDGEIHSMMKLAGKLTAVDEQISCDRAYLGRMSMRDGRHGRYADPDDFDHVGAQRILDPQ
ncbi:hypothetical protein CBR_g75710, partial [Chara braunii]